MTEPDKALLEDARIPRITIDGRAWPIPKLAPKQLEVVTPILVNGGRTVSPERMREMGTVVFLGMQRGHKGLTREEFDEFAVDFSELVEAYLVVGRQAGVLAPKKSEVNGVTEAPLPPAISPTGAP